MQYYTQLHRQKRAERRKRRERDLSNEREGVGEKKKRERSKRENERKKNKKKQKEKTKREEEKRGVNLKRVCFFLEKNTISQNGIVGARNLLHKRVKSNVIATKVTFRGHEDGDISADAIN